MDGPARAAIESLLRSGEEEEEEEEGTDHPPSSPPPSSSSSSSPPPPQSRGGPSVPALAGPGCENAGDPDAVAAVVALLPDPAEDERAHQTAWDLVMDLYGREMTRYEETRPAEEEGRVGWNARCAVVRVLLHYDFLNGVVVGGGGGGGRAGGGGGGAPPPGTQKNPGRTKYPQVATRGVKHKKPPPPTAK
jgi:hypothetical protein